MDGFPRKPLLCSVIVVFAVTWLTLATQGGSEMPKLLGSCWIWIIGRSRSPIAERSRGQNKTALIKLWLIFLELAASSGSGTKPSQV